ncbi:MAG TPA: hypothetical protein VMV78_00855 [Thiobacillus sp.]|nr:hypothetical protein [Thiobacillus sp.]
MAELVAPTIITMDVKDFAPRCTIDVKLKNARQWRWRVFLGVCLIRLAAWIMWVNVEFED